MRTVLPANMPAIWRSGDFTGANKPICRMTLQQAQVNLYNYVFTTNATPSTGGTGVGADDTALSPVALDSPLAGISAVGGEVGTGNSDTPEYSSGGGILIFDDGDDDDDSSTSTTGTSTGVVPSVETDARQSAGTVHQTYSSIIFNDPNLPAELPNVAYSQWQRTLDQDFATATFKFYNTAPLPIGTTPTRDLDMPGYYTYTRGMSSFSNRWGQTPNEWSMKLMPDNILRTYEGYGFDADEVPEKDPNLVQTGVWRIDKVAYTHDGVITVTARDIGSILGDQILFVPVVPPDFYPVSFAASASHVGIVAPTTNTYTQDDSGNYDPSNPPPADWTGPTAGPSVTVGAVGNLTIPVTIDIVPDGPTATDTTKGYQVVGYRILLDGVILPTVYKPTDAEKTAGSFTVNVPASEISNGNTYNLQAVAIRKEVLTKKGELYFKTNVENEQDSDASTAVLVRPGVTTAPTVTVNSINLNEDSHGNEVPGDISWVYSHASGGATWTVIAYTETENYTYTTTTSDESGQASVNVSDLGTLEDWNFVISGANTAGATGPGDVHFAVGGGIFWAIPTDGSPPHSPGPAPTSPTVTTVTTRGTSGSKSKDKNKSGGSGSNGTTTRSMNPKQVNISYDSSSNGYPFTHTVQSGDTLWALAGKYLGDSTQWPTIYKLNQGKIDRIAKAHGFTTDFPHWIFPGEVLRIPSQRGHTPGHAFDGSTSSYWLSDGHDRPDGASDMEWIQGDVNKVTLTEIKFNTIKSGYKCWVSVFAKGVWVQHDSGDKIPYVPESHNTDNGARIPFVKSLEVDDSSNQVVTFNQPIPGVTKIRLTFHNLQQNVDPHETQYAVGVQNVQAYGSNAETDGQGKSQTGGSGGTGKTGGSGSGSSSTVTTPAPVVAGPPQDDTDPSIVKSWTVYTPAHFDVGAGANPGQYNDYTDIIKLFTSWGGFFWPEQSTVMLSDGSEVTYDFGTTDYGLANVDPVLGADGSGRCWGDFMDTGTAGPAAITVENWDKQTLMDGVSTVRDIIGFIFYIDELGGVVWRQPNVYSVGNWISSYDNNGDRTSTIIEIDEEVQLIGLTATLDSTNVRERVFVATVDGSKGALANGWNPNPTGLRRVAGWTDMHFQSDAECQVMADLIALNQLFLYRTDSVVIPGYPAIQVDDQVRIFEQVTGEGYIHYVKGITSTLDMEQGSYTYQLDTHWLGEDPGDVWVFSQDALAQETQEYLTALTIPAGAALESDI